jgi:hypothetical protein
LLVKKGGHMAGYALLALAYLRGTGKRKHGFLLAFALTLAYALTDELHQVFTPGAPPRAARCGGGCRRRGPGLGLAAWQWQRLRRWVLWRVNS